jgi:hypothetical protein
LAAQSLAVVVVQVTLLAERPQTAVVVVLVDHH